ncbi:uncharacterized protein B4U79_01655 [Dinothrombium tinctorium]|uniref:Bcl-2 Bcl-2 homology region 1-3 domain-containing protein n=1 Tax=Dinothrombium tinctorium TaxID=1965070 RepID=A0A3S3NQR6_9ACAR|nr:uncharacterized protein B4U79_01655 [Dinothrombium tinctorium]
MLYQRMSLLNYVENITKSREYFDRFDAANCTNSKKSWKKKRNYELIVEYSKILCAVCVRVKLIKCGFVFYKRGLQRLRSIITIEKQKSKISEIAAQLKIIINELERHYPKIYSSVLSNTGNQLKMFSSFTSVKIVLELIAQELFRYQVTWERIAAFYAITGALAVDCVKTGHSNYVLHLVDAAAFFIGTYAAKWISEQGGWVCKLF